MSRESDWTRRTALLVLGITVTGLAGIIWALGLPPSPRNIVTVAGIAGATTAQATTGLRLSLTSASEMLRRQGPWMTMLSVPIGFLVGAAALMVTVAILSVEPTDVSISGAALLGGLYGLLFGNYWAGAAESSALRQLLAMSQEPGIESSSSSPKRTNWRGNVFAELHPKKGDRVSGEVVVWFEGHPAESAVPKRKVWRQAESEKPVARGKVHESEMGNGVHPRPGKSQGSFIIEGGDVADQASFVVTVAGSMDLEAFPRRQLVEAPVHGRSELYRFTLVRPERLRTPMEEPEMGAATPIRTVLLVDISMAGRTVQVLELRR